MSESSYRPSLTAGVPLEDLIFFDRPGAFRLGSENSFFYLFDMIFSGFLPPLPVVWSVLRGQIRILLLIGPCW